MVESLITHSAGSELNIKNAAAAAVDMVRSSSFDGDVPIPFVGSSTAGGKIEVDSNSTMSGSDCIVVVLCAADVLIGRVLSAYARTTDRIHDQKIDFMKKKIPFTFIFSITYLD